MNNVIQFYFRTFLRLLIFLPLIWVVVAKANYPSYRSVYLNDFQHIFNSEYAHRLTESLKRIKSKHGIEFTVVTIGSIADYQTGDDSIESFATNLFNGWGVGDSIKNNGVMLLVALHDRKLRIELGSGYGTQYDAAAKAVIDQTIVPYFKKQQFQAGIIAGVNAMLAELIGTGSHTNASPSPPFFTHNFLANLTFTMLAAAFVFWLLEHFFHTRWIQIILGLLVLTFFILALSLMISSVFPNTAPTTLVIWTGTLVTAGLNFPQLFRRYQRSRPRYCTHCQQRLQRLDEIGDDVYLDDGQLLEEELVSVNYDVWQCQACNFHDILPYKSFFSDYTRCEQCHYRTATVTSETLSSATLKRGGEKTLFYSCHYCHHEYQKIVHTPKLTESKRSNSFGGGRSSGGGASGSW